MKLNEAPTGEFIITCISLPADVKSRLLSVGAAESATLSCLGKVMKKHGTIVSLLGGVYVIAEEICTSISVKNA